MTDASTIVPDGYLVCNNKVVAPDKPMLRKPSCPIRRLEHAKSKTCKMLAREKPLKMQVGSWRPIPTGGDRGGAYGCTRRSPYTSFPAEVTPWDHSENGAKSDTKWR
jgi:hypothetical protein